jgi:uncharacterized protein YaiL (DUF2058 family)
MADSLRDQLLSLGLAKPRPAADAGRRPVRPKPQGKASADGKSGSRAEMDLARAYALRAQKEKEERQAAEREAQARARERRERKARLGALLEGRALNDPTAEVRRHFEHKGRIRHLHVTAEQLKRLNAGELAIVLHAGRYLLVERALAEQARAISDETLVLLVDPGAAAEDDVPPDLVW